MLTDDDRKLLMENVLVCYTYSTEVAAWFGWKEVRDEIS